MAHCRVPTTVVVADDDEDDKLLIKEAFSNECQCLKLHFVEDGAELLDYLDSQHPVQPALIFLDLNMPRMNGAEALERIKKDMRHKDIPIIMFTTSSEEDNVAKAYCLGASSYIRKPNTYEELQHIINIVGQYWCEVVLLPNKDSCDKFINNEGH